MRTSGNPHTELNWDGEAGRNPSIPIQPLSNFASKSTCSYAWWNLAWLSGIESESEVQDWSTRFSLEEGAPSPDILNDMERGVLHFVDGRKTVEDIATSLRESNLNTACYLMSLRLQGFIREAHVTTKRIATTTPVEAAPAQPPERAAPAAAAAPTQPQAPETTATVGNVEQGQAARLHSPNGQTRLANAISIFIAQMRLSAVAHNARVVRPLSFSSQSW